MALHVKDAVRYVKRMRLYHGVVPQNWGKTVHNGHQGEEKTHPSSRRGVGSNNGRIKKMWDAHAKGLPCRVHSSH